MGKFYYMYKPNVLIHYYKCSVMGRIFHGAILLIIITITAGQGSQSLPRSNMSIYFSVLFPR